MTIEKILNGENAKIVVVGRLDTQTAPELEEVTHMPSPEQSTEAANDFTFPWQHAQLSLPSPLPNPTVHLTLPKAITLHQKRMKHDRICSTLSMP